MTLETRHTAVISKLIGYTQLVDDNNCFVILVISQHDPYLPPFMR